MLVLSVGTLMVFILSLYHHLVFVYNFLSYVTIGSTPPVDQMVVLVLLAYVCVCASVYI